MKQTVTTIFGVLISVMIFAQAPQAFNYQGVARDLSGSPIPNQNIGLQIAILQGSTNGNEVYKETHNTTTTDLGLFNLQIGNGTVVSGSFADINWGSSSHFLQIGLDENGGINYQLIGTSELLSVPYALFAENSSSNIAFNDTTIYSSPILTFEPQSNSFELSNNAAVTNSSVGLLLNVVNSNNTNNKAGIYAISTEDYPQSANGDATDLVFLTEEYQNQLTEKMRITSSGNIGLNEVSPNNSLHIKIPASTSNGITLEGSTDLLSNPGLRFNHNDTTVSVIGVNLGGNTFYSDDAEIGDMVIRGNDHNMIFSTHSNDNFTADLYINTDGNVGIRTAQPEANLEIAGNTNEDILGLPGNWNLRYDKGATSSSQGGFDISNPESENLTFYKFEGDQITDPVTAIQFSNEKTLFGISQGAGNFSFPQALLVANDNGKIGVGTFDPKSKLQVTDGDIFIENINRGVIMKSPNGQCWRYTPDNSGQLLPTSITCPN